MSALRSATCDPGRMSAMSAQNDLGGSGAMIAGGRIASSSGKMYGW